MVFTVSRLDIIEGDQISLYFVLILCYNTLLLLVNVCFVVLGLASSVLSQKIGCEERLVSKMTCVNCVRRKTLT